MKIYIAAPLFSQAEFRFNEEVDTILRECGHQTYLPQRDGGCYAAMPDVINGITKEQILYHNDLNALDWCDTILLILDGRVPDEGACVELGYAIAKGKRCFGLKTDPRSFMFGKDNLMIRESLEKTFSSLEEIFEFFQKAEREI